MAVFFGVEPVKVLGWAECPDIGGCWRFSQWVHWVVCRLGAGCGWKWKGVRAGAGVAENRGWRDRGGGGNCTALALRALLERRIEGFLRELCVDRFP